MPDRSWDVVVVGGGPAGAATSAQLAERGHRVLLLDRDGFPRPKPCGECLNPAAVRLLAELGVLPQLLASGAAPLLGWRIHPAAGPAFAGRLPAGEPGMAISRTVLDSLLLDRARARGVEVRTGARVLDLLHEEDRVAGVRVRDAEGEEREVRARLVVGADGLRSVVVRRLGLIRRPPRLRKVALTAHVRGLEGLEGYGEFHIFPERYIGVAAVGTDAANVTVVAAGEEVGAVAGDAAGYFDRALGAAPRFAGAERLDEVLATGPFDWPTRSAVADGALLVGDAAGYYDPFTGQGIFRALRGAELAAETADAALRSGDISARALAPYDRAQRRAFAPGVRLQQLLELFISRRPLLNAVAPRLSRHPAMVEALLAVTGDVAPVRSLLRPGLRFVLPFA
ncbi:MAG: NAD(P)/FAD-dependent oxidoreductase [Gemmatimonadetes bacterium]|nr:NAD(P)/FAD-dependent oxidoreductase [Gemmatimonadota bacterium]